MGDWQNWIVGIILLLCITWVGRRFYLYLMKIKKNESPCSSCATGCALKNSVKIKEEQGCCSSQSDKKIDEKVDKQN